jgi:tetratricopeptide (TPR) repeat protein
MYEGFYSKAAALYKKLLKLNPQDEDTQLSLAEVSQKQGLLADAKAHLNAVAARRKSRGDRAGAAAIVVRLGSVDPADFDARTAAARMLIEMGDEDGAAARFRGMYDDLLEKGRHEEALTALRKAVALNPYDQNSRGVLAKAAIAAGDVEGARAHLDRQTAGDDPLLLMALLDIELKSGQHEAVRELLTPLLALGRDERQRIVDLGWSTAETNPEPAYVLIEAVVNAYAAAREYEDAGAMLQEFVARIPNFIPALLRLIEICVDGGLEASMHEAQAQLADAYLAAGQASEARAVAEDLVAREPWDRTHIDRFRRALVMLKVSDPDTLIAERLSGESPFMATDPFADTAPAASTVDTPADAAAPPDDASSQPGTAAIPPILTETSDAAMAALAVAPEAGNKKKRAQPGEIDLSGALEGAAGDPGNDVGAGGEKTLEEAFDEFRSEVSRQTGVDQSAQHMTLARTYLDMGMPDEAIESLKTASRAPRFRFEAGSLLGRLYRDKGDGPQAIEWFERAAEAPAPNIEEGRALLYDLGLLVEQGGDNSRALAIFLELQSEAGDYRDVAARIERLTRVEAGG